MIVTRAIVTRLSRPHGGNLRVSITELEDASKDKLSCPRYVQPLGREARESGDGWSMKLCWNWISDNFWTLGEGYRSVSDLTRRLAT